ncbi:MAG TPA: choice-of-anchor I family protein, partial [Bacteroidales bacterium]|nr:choice-of-anchor I family protein [Bacteroidales bacterium]
MNFSNFFKMMVLMFFINIIPLVMQAQNLKIFVASDLHYFAPELIINDGTALEQYLAMDRKLLRESHAIFDAIIDTILSIQPDVVFFTGDLTKDGELVSHQYVAENCQLLEDNGIQVFVIPGNHDINNPHAYAFDGDNVIPVDSISPQDFSAIYANFGFNEAIAHDPNSLTYIVEPFPGLQIFGMDVCRYDNNYAANYPETGGGLSEESYNWIMQKLQEAKATNKRVLGLMHHGLVEHYVGQKQLFPDYVIDGWDTISVNFADAGMEAVFTGHYHSHDIVEKTSVNGNTIFDIETGSSVTWPCPFRTIEITDNSLVDIKTGLIDDIDYDLGGQSFQDYAYDYISAGFPILVNYILTQQYGIPQFLADQMNPAVTEGFLQHYYGDEPGPSAQSMAVIQFLVTSGDPQLIMFGNLIMSIFTDPAPSDWEFSFEMFVDKAIQSNPTTLYSSQSGTIFKGGYGSAMFAVPGQPDLFYMITDRGPNVNGLQSNVKVFPVPGFTPEIGIFRLEDGELVRQDSILLKRNDGTLLSGLPNPVGMGSTGETGVDLDGNILGTDPEGIDSEGLVVMQDGSFWVSDEYGPHIVHFDAGGNTIERINPFGTGTGGRMLPAVFAKRWANRGMEGLAITPDEKTLVGIMQSVLYNPDKNSIVGKNITRLVTFDIETGHTKQFVYLQNANNLSNSEITAISNTEFLVVERDGLYQGGANPAVYKRVYKIYTDGATDVSDPANGEFGLMFQGGTKTLEQLSAAQLIAEGIVPVRKVLVADLLTDVPSFKHDKLEGIGLLNDQLIAVCNDNDFGILPDGNGGYMQKILPGTTEVDLTTLYLLELEESLSMGYKDGNIAPEVTAQIPDQSLTSGDLVTINLADYFSDPDNDLISFKIALPNGTSVPEWIKYDQFAKTLTLCPAYPATLTVEVAATDLIDKTSQEFNIDVVVANPMLTYLSGIKLGSWDEGAAEISAYDAGTKKLFVTNAEFTTLDIIDLSDPSNPVKVDDIDITPYGAGLQSVAVYNGVVAVAVQSETSTDPGFVVFFDTDGNFLSQATVGSLPDMLIFTPDGTKLLVANEGEPNDDYTVDPEGSVSIIDMTVGAANLTNANVITAGFAAFNGAILDAGIRIFGPGASVAQDIEPEYIAISPDGTKAYVTCQENNAFAVVDIATATITDLLGMGFKNHNLPGNGMDASDKSSSVQIKSWPVFGMYLPDAVDSYSVNGNTYYVTVNEGDARDYDGYSEEARVKDLNLDPVAFPNASWLKKNENLGRLKTTTANGDIDNDGFYEEIYCYGGRSFTIWNENGEVVFDSQDDFEQITAGYLNHNFNSSNDENDSFKNRSDDKGPEPEALKIAQIEGRYYAFIGLERVGGIMVYDVTNPNFPEFVEYRNDRNFAVDAEDDLTGHYGPEGILFIKSTESGNGQPLVVVSHEVSGSVAIYQVNAANAVLPQMLTILHNNDGESQLTESSYGPAYGGVANFKFKADSLRNEAFSKLSPAIMLSSGDNFLAGPEFSASLNLPADQPYYDAVAMDHIGYDAVCMGNHDFDFGPDVLEKFIRDYSLTQPPYLSANLDFSNEPGLQNLVDNGRIRKSTVVNLNGTYVGVVGLTTPMLDYISSPRNVIVNDDLVTIAQGQIDSLLNLGLNKIILISHLQSIKEDSILISQLRHVDIAIAGGGDELLTNDPSIALPGMDIYGNYPLEYEDADGNTVYVVTTPGEYTYVGHLMAEFDVNGNVVSIDPASNPVLVTNTTPDEELVELVEEPVTAYVANLAQNIIATTEVTLDGVKNNVRTLETNEGDLVADATLWQATQLAPAFGVNLPDVAFQNGGGIRNNTLINAGSNISELTTFDILPFPNFVAIVENVSPSQFKEVLENAVSRVEFVDGRFAQISGFEFTWDPAGTRQIITDGVVTTPGTRVIEAKLANGTMIIANGSVVPNAPAINIATIDFLAKGGDQYPLT